MYGCLKLYNEGAVLVEEASLFWRLVFSCFWVSQMRHLSFLPFGLIVDKYGDCRIFVCCFRYCSLSSQINCCLILWNHVSLAFVGSGRVLHMLCPLFPYTGDIIICTTRKWMNVKCSVWIVALKLWIQTACIEINLIF